MKKKIVRYIFCVSIACTLSGHAFTQNSVDSFRFINELFQIENAFLSANHLSFGVRLYLEDHDTTSLVTDTIYGSGIIHGENYYLIMDSVEQVQNENYKVSVFHHDSIMQVESRSSLYKTLFRLDLYDRVFQELNVTGVQFSDSGPIRTMSFDFLRDAPYISFELQYDTVTRFITSLTYKAKKSIYLTPISGPMPASVLTVKVLFLGYSTGSCNDSVFGTARFFKSENGGLTPVTPFSGFELINATSEQ